MKKILAFSLSATIFVLSFNAWALRCEQALSNSFNIVKATDLTLEKSESEFWLQDKNNEFVFLIASLTKGVLNFSIVLKDSHKGLRSSLKGSELYKEMIHHFGLKNIEEIHGMWVEGTNYEQFFSGLSKGLSHEQAALQTWSGRKALENGFSRVDLVELNPNPITGRISVQVVFTRP